MNQLNVRNVDETLWREFRSRAAKRRIPVGKLLNEALEEWLVDGSPGRGLPPDAAERVHRAMGLFKDLDPSVSWTDEFLKMRREEFEKEQREFEELERRHPS